MKIQPTLTIQLDDKIVLVSECSETVKTLISYYDDWRQKEYDINGELLMVKSAMRDIQNVIHGQITLDNKPKQETNPSQD